MALGQLAEGAHVNGPVRGTWRTRSNKWPPILLRLTRACRQPESRLEEYQLVRGRELHPCTVPYRKDERFIGNPFEDVITVNALAEPPLRPPARNGIATRPAAL